MRKGGKEGEGRDGSEGEVAMKGSTNGGGKWWCMKGSEGSGGEGKERLGEARREKGRGWEEEGRGGEGEGRGGGRGGARIRWEVRGGGGRSRFKAAPPLVAARKAEVPRADRAHETEFLMKLASERAAARVDDHLTKQPRKGSRRARGHSTTTSLSACTRHYRRMDKL